MVMLKVQYGPAFFEITKKTRENLQFDSPIVIHDLLEYYYEKYGQDFKKLVWKNEEMQEYHDQLVIIINGKTYRDENFLKTPLKDGDNIYFLYEYFGG
ncbi:MAG: hypothetical protein EU544_05440 [Promethearchaeota archaeon]|nr:MAG: hypothetical protein EU544_05440 [Candidatus Lokiarchaeota archaeon]